jgi:hypothetical protein
VLIYIKIELNKLIFNKANGELYESLWQTQALAFIFCCGQTMVNHLALPMAVIKK